MKNGFKKIGWMILALFTGIILFVTLICINYAEGY